MVAYFFEEDAAAQQRYLQRGDVDVCVEIVPGVGPYGISDQGCEETIEVEEEENGQDAAYEELNQVHPNRGQRLRFQGRRVCSPIEAITRVQGFRND